MRYLGLDLGTRSLGVALSDKLGLVASFYENIRYENEDELIKKISNIINENNVEKVVLGLPKNMNNTLGDRATDTIRFKEKLENEVQKEVILEDERLTSKISNNVLINGDMSRKKRKNVVDGVASVIILQSYLDRKE